MLKYGFFDSIKGDRKYNSKDVAELFDGIIVDGIYAQIGERFAVNSKKVIETEEDRMTVTVGTGQAWLSHTKILNTSKLELTLSQATGANRYDAILIEVNENKREVNIFVKQNLNATDFNLANGQLINTEFVHQYLLAVILVEAGEIKIKQENIAYKVGFDLPKGIPYVTCPLEPFPVDENLEQWTAQWTSFFSGSNSAFNAAQQQRDNDYQSLRTMILNWLNSTETDWGTWFESVKNDHDGYVDSKIEEHNTSNVSHTDMRTAIRNLTTRLNTLADSDDTDLDQLSEIVAFIKENRDTIQVLTDVTNEGLVLNTKTKAGYVPAGGSNVNKVWSTDLNGNPGWRETPEKNFINSTYVTAGMGAIDAVADDLDFITSHPQGVFGHSDKLFAMGLGYWNEVIWAQGNNISNCAQIAIGLGGRMATRYKEHNYEIFPEAWTKVFTSGDVIPFENGGTVYTQIDTGSALSYTYTFTTPNKRYLMFVNPYYNKTGGTGRVLFYNDRIAIYYVVTADTSPNPTVHINTVYNKGVDDETYKMETGGMNIVFKTNKYLNPSAANHTPLLITLMEIGK